MTKTVFIFGAGASHGTGVPLMHDFVARGQRLHSGLPPGATKDAFDLVFKRLIPGLRGLHANSAIDLDNIETLYGLVEMGGFLEKLPGIEPGDETRARNAVRRFMATTIEAKCLFACTPAGGLLAHPSYEAVAMLAGPGGVRSSPGDLALITLNYDIALDVALALWNVDVDYGLENESTGLPLLKIHGSLNWTVCPGCERVVALPPARLLEHATAASRCDPDVRLVPASRYLRHIDHCGAVSAEAEPFLVPPIWNKTDYHRFVRQIWRRAAQVVEDADQIFIVGHSLPESDGFFRYLLALGLLGWRRVQQIMVVDPSQSVSKRFEALLGAEARKVFGHFPPTFDPPGRFEEFVGSASFPGTQFYTGP